MLEFFFEMMGAMMLSLFGIGASASSSLIDNTKYRDKSLIKAFGWFIGVFTGIMFATPNSKAHLNPAITICLCIISDFPFKKVPIYILAQIIGSIIGAYIIWILYKHKFTNKMDTNFKISIFTSFPKINNKYFYSFINEIICTSILLIIIISFFTKNFFINNEISSNFILNIYRIIYALRISLIISCLGISLNSALGSTINPARDLGARIVYSFLPISNKEICYWGYSWVPILGPIFSAIIIGFLYKYFNLLFYN